MLRFVGAALALAVCAGGGLFRAAEAEKAKYSIEEIMEKAHDKDDGLLKKVFSGKAAKADKEQLLDLYKELAKNTPPKGDEKSWKTKTAALVAGATAVVKEDKNGLAGLKMAANCKACHSIHR
jgi:hypothetical protein